MKRLSIVLAVFVAVCGISFLSSVAAQTPSAAHTVHLPLVLQQGRSPGQNPTPTRTATATPTPVGPIRIEIVTPKHNALVGDDLEIQVRVRSTYEIEEVVAYVGARRKRVVLSLKQICSGGTCGPAWVRSVSLANFERGPQQLVVFARDTAGNAAETEQQFVHDRQPVLSVTSPLDATVARPEIRVTAQCLDDDPQGCTRVSVSVQQGTDCVGPVLSQGATAINQAVSLAGFEGKTVRLCIKAVDSAGQQLREIRTVRVESSKRLRKVINAPAPIIDVQGQRVLILTGTDAFNRLDLYDNESGETIKVANNVNGQQSFLTPFGVIFMAAASSPDAGRVTEWRNGVRQDLAFGAYSLKVSGNYAIWLNTRYTYRYDQASNTTIEIDGTGVTNGRNTEMADLAPNGDVAYTLLSDVYWYRNGSITRLTNDVSPPDIDPTTDGVHVVYVKIQPGFGYSTVLHDGSNEIALTPVHRQQPQAGPDYQLRNGWIAFTRPGPSGVLQVWTRSPDGGERQITSFATNSSIQALNDTGEVIFRNGDRLYLATSDRTVELDFVPDRIFVRDGQWYVVIGRTLFSLITTSE